MSDIEMMRHKLNEFIKDLDEDVKADVLSMVEDLGVEQVVMMLEAVCWSMCVQNTSLVGW